MKKSIKVIIDENGNLEADFSGFRGNECESEEKRLRERLEKYGLAVKNQKIIPKPIEIDQVIEFSNNKILEVK